MEMSVDDELTRFREWCGDEKFARFVGTLESTCREKARLMFWQEELITKFNTETGIVLPTAVNQLLQMFEQVIVAVPSAAQNVRFSAAGFEELETVRAELLAWSAKRRLSGLNWDVSISVASEPRVHAAAAEAVKTLFLDDPQINTAFVGATISVRIKPDDAQTPSTGLTIHVDDRNSRGDDGSVCLQWTIGAQEPKRPWWKVW